MNRIALSLIFLLSCLTVTSAVPQRAVRDFDGDNKTDYGIVRPVFSSNTGIWYIQRSTAGFMAQNWGAYADLLVPADYDGDLKWDLAVWREFVPTPAFYIFQSQSNTMRVVPFGLTGDGPFLVQDFDGDGKADPTVTRDVGGTLTWYIQRSLLGLTTVRFGNATTDYGVRGDFDGDGKADVAVYRRNTGTPANTFFVLRSSDGGIQAQQLGNSNMDSESVGDYDGDGKTDYAILRLPSYTWYRLHSSDGSFHTLAFGGSGDFPLPGDFDGDGKTDQAVWRQGSPSIFYVNRSTLGFIAYPFGVASDLPLIAH